MNVPSLATNSWVHYAYVLNLSNYTQSNYLNGILVNSSTVATSSYGNVSEFDLGIYYFGCEYASHGVFDDFRIYNRALSAAEIQAMYNAEK